MLYGMDYHDSTDPHRQLDGSCYWVPDGFFGTLIDAILGQLKRAGFKMVFADGHGPSRFAWCSAIPKREQRFGLKLAGVTEGLLSEWKSQTDHASRNETSLVLHYREDLTDLSQLPADRNHWPQGISGEDPRDASSEYGKKCMEGAVTIVGRLIEKSGV